MLILALISLIPIAGGLIILMLDLFGFGTVLRSRVGTIQLEAMHKLPDLAESLTPSSNN